jgi:hypothetical protein
MGASERRFTVRGKSMFGLCHWRQELSRVTLAMSFASAPLFLDAAHAADKFFIRATPTAQQTTRYEQGVAKLYDEGGTSINLSTIPV